MKKTILLILLSILFSSCGYRGDLRLPGEEVKRHEKIK